MSDAAMQAELIHADDFDVLDHSIRIASAQMDVPHKNASCGADVWFTAFFDGTGDNLYHEELRPPAQQALSNIGKLFRAHHVRNDLQGLGVYYAPGVGTAFPEIGDSGGGMGAAMGYMGIERIVWMVERLKQTINRQRERGFKVKVVHVAVFGFSRGATLARAFVSRLSKEAIFEGGQWTRDGARLRIYFLGVIDTVASVGLPRAHETYAENLSIPETVEQCVHLVAGHELRFAFPLDSIRRHGKYPVGTTEYVFPGVHSDVGGGYSESEQGRSNDYAAIPLSLMYQKGKMAGVPFGNLTDLNKHTAAFFTIPPALVKTFRGYMSALECTGGSVEEQMFSHLKLYWRWRKLRMGDASAPIPQRLADLERTTSQQDMLLSQQLGQLRTRDEVITRGAIYQNVPFTSQQVATLKSDEIQSAALKEQIETDKKFTADRAEWKEADETMLAEAKALARTVKSLHASQWEKAVWGAWSDHRDLAPDVINLFDNYIHDSQAAWNHRLDAPSVGLTEVGASLTCSRAFTEQAARYCAELEREVSAGKVEYLRPRTLFFGKKEDVFAASDTGY